VHHKTILQGVLKSRSVLLRALDCKPGKDLGAGLAPVGFRSSAGPVAIDSLTKNISWWSTLQADSTKVLVGSISARGS